MATNQSPASEAAVVFRDVVKVCHPGVRAPANVSFDLYRGETVALLGPNGAGKSTAIDTMLGLRTQTSGEVRVLGGTPAAAVAAGRIGGMLQTSGLRPHRAGGGARPPPETGMWPTAGTPAAGHGGGMMSCMTTPDGTDPPPGDDLDRSVSGMLRIRRVVIGVLVTVFLALPAVALFRQQGLSGDAAFLVPGTVVFVVLVDRWVLVRAP